MLVNLSPKPTFRTESEIWAKEYNRFEFSSQTRKKRHEWETKKAIPEKFDSIFVPCGICGVYREDIARIDGDTINHNCKQHALYDDEFFRRIRNIEDLEERMKYQRNCWFFGVADNIEQVVDFYNKNKDGVFAGNHVITFFDVYRNKNNPYCGWRWHKWGLYIGEKKPVAEYLNDEPEIDHVICFNIYKVV